MDKTHIGKNLKYLRFKYGLTQEDIGKLFDSNKSVVASYELGRSTPSYKNLIIIAKYFKISIDDFLLRDIEAEGVSDSFDKQQMNLATKLNAAEQRIKDLESIITAKDELIAALKDRT